MPTAEEALALGLQYQRAGQFSDAEPGRTHLESLLDNDLRLPPLEKLP
jgi:hypothetical protein